MAKKSKTLFSCQNCGFESLKWLGQCGECGEWGTFEEEVNNISDSKASGRASSIQNISDVESVDQERYSSGSAEFDRVLGGSFSGDKKGFVVGQVLLLSGEPGIGKSTILLQLMFNNVSRGINTVYVSGEESVGQVAIRVDRLLHKSDKFGEEIKQGINVLNEYNLENILATLDSMSEKPRFMIVDSIQTMYSDESRGISGSISQIRVCVNRLVQYAKQNKITVIIVGHINKDGNIAGPKMLEHMVDTVFQLEGDEVTGLRMLRSLKNRFGPTMEVGIFQMVAEGLIDMDDPSDLFDSGLKENLVGVCKSVVVEGQRPVLLEVQALTSPTPFSLPKRVAEGIPVARLQRISAILSKYTKVDLSEKDIYVKISGNLKVQDPSVDLAIAVSIISSIKNKPISYKAVAIGEVNLTGRIAKVVRLEDREKEAKRLGYSNVVTAANCKNISSLIKSPLFV